MADFEVKFSEINKSFKLVESGGGGSDSGTGLTDAAKQAMLQIARNVAYIDEHGQTYYNDLYDALYGITAVRLNRTSLVMANIGSTSQLIATTVPAGGTVTWASSDTSVATVDDSGLVTSVALGSCTITATAGRITATCAVSVVEATLVSIDAVYTQSGTVYDTADLDDLKTDLVVTASWSSGTTSEVSSSDYALSGTLAVGTSVVTVTYGECTDTFTVNVTAAPTLTSISAVYTQSGTVYDTDSLDSLKDDLVVTAIYSDSSTQTVTDYTLSGTLAVGTSTVTVTYSGKITTFTVTVTEKQGDLIFTEPLTMKSTNAQFSWDSETQTGSGIGYGNLSWGSLVAQNLLYKFSDVSDKSIRISYTLTLSDLVEGHTGTGSFLDIGLYTSANPANAGSNRKAQYNTTKYQENGTYTIDETYDLSTIFTDSGLENYYLGVAWFMHLTNQGTSGGTVHGTISNVRVEVI